MVEKQRGFSLQEISKTASEGYNLAKRRVEASKIIADHLISDDFVGYKSIVREVVRRNGFLNANAIDYDLKRAKKVYNDPEGSGEPITEELVYFLRVDGNGNPKRLKVGKNEPLILNADLYDVKFYAGRTEPRDIFTRFVPIVDNYGNIEDVVALTEKVLVGSE